VLSTSSLRLRLPLKLPLKRTTWTSATSQSLGNSWLLTPRNGRFVSTKIYNKTAPIFAQCSLLCLQNQDQYAVLGLSALRYRATTEQIKKAHHKKVLRHHPDKKAGAVGDSNDDSFFKCIQKAFDTLINPEKRRQWDSVDPVATAEDDELVPLGKVEPEEFFESWAPLFEREVCNKNENCSSTSFFVQELKYDVGSVTGALQQEPAGSQPWDCRVHQARSRGLLRLLVQL
jgi:hypothetical protein